MSERPRAVAAVALLVCLVALTACSDVQEPVVTITGVDLHGLSTEGLALHLIVDVENPNPFGADIGELEYRVLLDDTEVATGLQEDAVAVPAKSTVEVKIPFTIVWSGMDEGLSKLLDGEEHDWRLKGRVKLSKGAISRTFRFSEGGRYEAPRASDIDIDLDL
jgi:LEA14-like dessication related protein